ncbi:MAG: amidohydrolase family protein, partial [Bradyrhizobium sp.]
MSTILFKNAALLDPLRSDLLEGHHVLVEDRLIKEVSDRPIEASVDRVIDLKGKTLMPGLIDLHVHAVAVELDLSQQARMANVLVTLRSTMLLRGMLKRGFTTVRDAGGAGYALKQAIDTGLTDGPRLFVSGRALSQTGGHGDGRARSDYLADPTCSCCVRVGA